MMKNVWQHILGLLKRRIGGQAFNVWIRPISFVALEGEELVIETPNTFSKEWIENHYLNDIREAAAEVEGGVVKVKVLAKENVAQEKRVVNTQVSKPHFTLAHTNVNERYTFENFVVGASNQFAHAASIAVANNPARSYNPLFIFGGVGLGKTHLLNAIGHHVLKNNICKKVCYITSEQFTNELINSIRYERMSSFRERFRSLEMLLLDDIEFMAGKERTQEEFFHTFNSLYESHQQIVITSDTFPKDMHFLEERLRSRFEWGLIADIQTPEIETKVAIIKQKSRTYNIAIPNDVAFFIASNVTSNIRELEGFLNRIVAYSSLNNCEITIDLAKDVLKDLIKSREKDINIGSIQKEVSNYFNVKLTDIRSNKKQKGFVIPRQISMYLSRKLTNLSYPEIASHFGGKDHSTIIYAFNKIEKMMQHDQNIRELVNKLINKLSG